MIFLRFLLKTLGTWLVLGVLALAQAQPKELHVVTDDNYPPYLYKDADGRNVGYLVDLWKLWEQKTGTPVKLTATRWVNAQSMLQQGEADVIDMIFRTPDREAQYEFSTPYAELPVAIFSHTSISGIHDVPGLRGFQIGVQAGDACIEKLRSQGITTLHVYPNYAALMDAAVASEIKLFCLDELPAHFYLYQRNAHRTFVKAFELYKGQFHRAVRKGQMPTLLQVQKGMEAISPQELAELQSKWMGERFHWAEQLKPFATAAAVLAGLTLTLTLWVLSLRRVVQRRTAEMLRERTQLRALVNAIPDLVWVKDPLGVYTSCNARFEQLFGARSGEIIGKTDFDFVDVATAEFFRHHDRRAAESGLPSRNEEELTFASDGHVERLQTIKTPIYDDAGQLLGVLGIARDVTDLLETQEALSRSLERLKQAEHMVRLGHWEIDVGQAHLSCTDEVYAIYGLESADSPPTVEDLLALTPPEDREPLRQVFTGDWPAEQTTSSLVTRLTRPSGEVRHVHVRAHFEAASDTTSARRVGTLQDVTEQVSTQLELLARQEIFAAIAGQATESIALVEPETMRFVEFNQAAHRNLGYSAEEFAQLGIPDINASDTPEQLKANMAGMLTPEGLQFEKLHRHRDGQIRDVRISARGVEVRGRRYVAAIWTDITESKAQSTELDTFRHQLQTLVDERTTQLQELTERLEKINEEQAVLFDSAPVGIVLLQNRVVQRCNRRLEELLASPPGAMIGHTTRSWYPDEAACAAGGDPVYTLLQRGERHSREQELVRWDGTRFWARLTGQMLDPAHPDKGTLFIIEDVEQEHLAAQALRAGKDMAESAARMKTDFLANMSHEIRTPLNAVLGIAHLALRTELSAKQRDYLNRIQASGKHLLSIINSILDLSKIDSGKMELERSEFALDALLSNLGNLIGDKASAKGLELLFDVAPNVPARLYGDALRLGQILINYGNNAIKFTDHGEISISVRLLQR